MNVTGQWETAASGLVAQCPLVNVQSFIVFPKSVWTVKVFIYNLTVGIRTHNPLEGFGGLFNDPGLVLDENKCEVDIWVKCFVFKM